MIADTRRVESCLVPKTSTNLVASDERPAAAFSATQVKFWEVPGMDGVHLSSFSWTEKKLPMGKPCLNCHLTVQSTFKVQLVKQVNLLNLPGKTASGPLMLTFQGSTTRTK